MDKPWLESWIVLIALCELSVCKSPSIHDDSDYRAHICRHTKSPDLSATSLGVQSVDVDGHGSEHATTRLQCLNTKSLVRVDVHKNVRRFHVTFQACENVVKVILHLQSQHFFKKNKPHGRTVNCNKIQDTLVLSHPMKRQVVTIAPIGRESDLRLFWAFQYYVRPNVTQWGYGTAHRISDQGTSPVSSTAAPERPVARDKRSNAVEVEEPVMKKEEPECGKKLTCVRFGSEHCKHLECDYLLTYSVTNRTFLELEMSAKSDGWVALGLSSDDQMGGDDVIVCKRKSVFNTEVEALSMSIGLPHTRPKPKPDNPLNLISHRLAGGYIHCKMIRYLEEEVSDTRLDLTNNWYQLYAKGDIDKTGLMLQHDQKPPTSSKTVSMLRPFDSYNSQFKNGAESLHTFLSTLLFMGTIIISLVLI